MVSRKEFKDTADGLGYSSGEVDAAWRYVSGGQADISLAELHEKAAKPGQHRRLIEDVALELGD